MRHRMAGRKLGRTSAHRKALFRNQLTALFTHERIITTLAKAKELRPLAERMVTMARTGTLPNRRRVLKMVPDKEIVRRLFDDIAPRFADRPGGYTRILRLGRRHGDNAELAIIEFVDYEVGQGVVESGADSKRSLVDRARGMFGGRDADAEPAAEVTDETAAEAASEADEDAEAPAEKKAEAKKAPKAAKKTAKKPKKDAADDEAAAEATSGDDEATADDDAAAEASPAEDETKDDKS